MARRRLRLNNGWLQLGQDDDEQGGQERMVMPQRSFPPPWTTEELNACFIVRDRAGLNLAYVYFQEDSGYRSAVKLLSRSEARRIATKIAKLPESPCT